MSIKSLDNTVIDNLNVNIIECNDVLTSGMNANQISSDTLFVDGKRVSGDEGGWTSLNYTVNNATFVGDIGGTNPVHFHYTDDDVRISGSLEVKTFESEFTISFTSPADMNNGSFPMGIGSGYRTAGTANGDKMYLLSKVEKINNSDIRLTYRTIDGSANTAPAENRTVYFDIVYKYLLQ